MTCYSIEISCLEMNGDVHVMSMGPGSKLTTSGPRTQSDAISQKNFNKLKEGFIVSHYLINNSDRHRLSLGKKRARADQFTWKCV